MIPLATKSQRAETETSIMQSIRETLCSRDDVRVFRNNVGKLADRHGRWVTYGLAEGSGDLIGMVTTLVNGRHHARFLSLEVKRPGAQTKPDIERSQEAWRQMVRKFGGVAEKVHSVAEAVDVVERAKRWEL